MKYTENQIIGMEVEHKTPPSKYRIISILNSRITTESIHDNNQIIHNWATVDEVNRWLQEGIWILKKIEYSEEIY